MVKVTRLHIIICIYISKPINLIELAVFKGAEFSKYYALVFYKIEFVLKIISSQKY